MVADVQFVVESGGVVRQQLRLLVHRVVVVQVSEHVRTCVSVHQLLLLHKNLRVRYLPNFRL